MENAPSLVTSVSMAQCTVVVSKTHHPFSFNFEAFLKKSGKYREILPSKIILKIKDQAQSLLSIRY